MVSEKGGLVKFWKKGELRTATRNDVIFAGATALMAVWAFIDKHKQYQESKKEINESA
jgi:hypothetical protein